MYTFDPDTERTTHCLLHCARQTFFKELYIKLVETFQKESDSTIAKVPLFGDNELNFETNKTLLVSTIGFIQPTERFSYSL